MIEERVALEREYHQKFAKDLFNYTWQLLDKPERSRDEDDRMIHAAHASRFHWGEVGTPVNWARGEWQISRVYTVLKRPEPALYHAQRCLDLCQVNHIGDFDVAYAYEALARAYAIGGKQNDVETYMQLAREAGEQIAEQDDKELFERDLATLPGYGERI